VQKRRRILRERGGIRIQEPGKGGTRVLWCLVKGKGRGKDGLAWGRLRGLDSYMNASGLRGVAIGRKVEGEGGKGGAVWTPYPPQI
jgi:hypothetical protein